MNKLHWNQKNWEPGTRRTQRSGNLVHWELNALEGGTMEARLLGNQA